MANLGIQFDANQVAPQTEMGAVPAGWYPVTILKSEMKSNGKKNGSYLALEFSVVEGHPLKGRKFFTNLNLNNPNQTAVEIAQAELSAICHSVGVFVISDSNQLHGLPFDVKIGIEPAGEGTDGKQYPDRNIVQGYRKLETVLGATVSHAPSNAGNAGVPAWATQPQTQPAPQIVQPQTQPQPTWQPAPQQPQQTEVIKTMTEKAGQYTYESFIQQGWTDEAMIRDGYLVITQPQAQPQAPVSNTPPWQSAPQQNVAQPGQSMPQPSQATTSAPPPWQR